MCAKATVDFTPRPARPATAATFSVPVEPALTRPVESTPPSNRPPVANQRITASGIARPLESYATAWSRTVSPTSRAYSAGFTSTRAMGCGTLDRKSTRLNSSHLVISYAVFCLKKKNKNNVSRHDVVRTQRDDGSNHLDDLEITCRLHASHEPRYVFIVDETMLVADLGQHYMGR